MTAKDANARTQDAMRGRAAERAKKPCMFCGTPVVEKWSKVGPICAPCLEARRARIQEDA